MVLKVRIWHKMSIPPRMLYWGKDFFHLKCKVFHSEGFPDVVDIRVENSPGNKHFSLTPHNFILMVSTGWKDKDGEEIWSGDIISDGKKNYPIYYDEKHCQFRAKGYNFPSQDTPWDFTEEPYLIKKVGNIYENPELLEKKTI